MDSLLSDPLLEYLLSATDGHRFERLVQELLALRDGEAFVALGGVKDDAAQVSAISEMSGRREVLNKTANDR